MNTQVRQLIDKLDLKPHPEGGFFRETYRSAESIPQHSLSKMYRGDRHCSTSIYFLLTSGLFSAFHKIHQDEIWHFYLGDPIIIHMIDRAGHYLSTTLGIDIQYGQAAQFMVKGGTWFASEVIASGHFGLVGCTVSPGFDFSDFTLANRHELTAQFPEHKNLISKLTRNE